MPYRLVSKHEDGATLKEIAGDLDIDFSKGQGFYELIKKEKVSAKKSLVLFKNKKFLSDDLAEVKKLCGLNVSGDLTIEPKHIPANHQLFVQSTSPNRKIAEDASVLFEVDDLGSDGDEDENDDEDNEEEEDDNDEDEEEVASPPPLIHQRSVTFQFTAFQASFLIPIVSEWMELMDLNSLDTALTNKYQRNVFLPLILSKSAVFSGYIVKKQSYTSEELLLEWVKLRGMKLDYYYGTADEILETLKKDNFDLSRVKSLHLDDEFLEDDNTDDDEDEETSFDQEAFDRVVSLVNSCPQLTSLTFKSEWHTGDEGDDERVIIDAVKLLTQIDPQIVRQLHRIPIIVEEDFEFVAEHCSNLTDLFIVSHIYNEDDQEALDEIVKRNPKIKSICFGEEKDDGRIDKELFPYFKELNLDYLQFTEEGIRDPSEFLDVFTDVHTVIVRCHQSDDYLFDRTHFTYNGKERALEVFYKQYELVSGCIDFLGCDELSNTVTTVKIFNNTLDMESVRACINNNASVTAIYLFGCRDNEVSEHLTGTASPYGNGRIEITREEPIALYVDGEQVEIQRV